MNISGILEKVEKAENELSKKAAQMEKTYGSSLDAPVAKDVKVIPDSPEGYNRPYLRESTREEIYNNSPKDSSGRYLDANTGLPIDGKPDIGHKPGHEFWREAKKAYNEGLTQQEFNEKMNNPNLYQLEDPHNNRSHRFEDKSEF
jgi:hypothetical protein